MFKIENRWFEVGDRVIHALDGATGTVDYIMGISGGEETRYYRINWDDQKRNDDVSLHCIEAINLKKVEDTSLK